MGVGVVGTGVTGVIRFSSCRRDWKLNVSPKYFQSYRFPCCDCALFSQVLDVASWTLGFPYDLFCF